MLDQLGRKAALVFVLSFELNCAASCREERLAYQNLIGRKNPLSSMRLRQ